MNGRTNSDTAVGRRRQRIVLHVHEMETPATIDELVDRLVEDPDARSDAPGEPTSWDDFHRELYEFDLPALADVGLIQFDEERGVVADPVQAVTDVVLSETDESVAASETTEHAGETRRPWALAYLVLSVLAAVALGWVRYGTETTRILPVASVVVGSYLALSTAQFVIDRRAHRP